MNEAVISEKIDNNNVSPSDNSNNNVEINKSDVPSDISPSSGVSSASSKSAVSKQSGIRPPSRIGRPCGGIHKPAIPATPTKYSSDDSMRRLTDDFGRHKLTDLVEADESEEDCLDYYLRSSTRRNRYFSIGSTASSMDGLWELHPRRLSEAGLSRHSDSSAVLTEDTDSFMIGQRVWVGGTKPGTIAYIGETQFAPGDWAGIALEEPIGKNDGSVGGVRYFQCENKKGVFSKLTRLTRVPLEQPGMGSNETFISPNNNGVRRSPVSPTGSTSGLLRSALSLSNSNTSLASNATHIDFKIGDRVIIKSTQGSKIGTVRYMGLTDFAPGEWVGVELDDPRGKNDGSVEGKRYFECRPHFGLFAPASKVSKSPSKHKPSACVVHSGPGLPPSGLKRSNSKESMASLASKTSAVSSVRRVRLGVTSLTPKKVAAKTSTPLPTRTALQDVLREKQQHIEQLLKERDLERAEITRAASQADEAEQRFYTLKQEFEKHRAECEEKVRADTELLSQFKIDRAEVLNQLEEEKRKNEDLQFRFEEASITKSDVEAVNENHVKKIGDLELKLEEERRKNETLEVTSNKLFEAEENLIKTREEVDHLKKEVEESRQKRSAVEEEGIVSASLVESLKNQIEGTGRENEEKSRALDLLREEIAKITSEDQRFKREIAEYKKKSGENCQEKDNEIEKLRAELEHEKKLNEKYRQTHAEMAKEIEKLKMDLSAKSLDLETGNEEITAKNHEIKLIRNELETVREEVSEKMDDLERHKTNSKEVEENLRKEIEQTREDLKSKISEVETAKKECNVQISQKDQQLQESDKTITEMRGEMEKLTDELASAKTSFEESKSEIHSRHARQVASQDSQLMALSSELEQKNEEITKSSIVISKLEEDLCTKNGIIEKLRLELESCENRHSTHSEASAAMGNRFNELTLANGELQRQLSAANERIKSLISEQQRLQNEIRALSARGDNVALVEQLRNELQARQNMLESLRIEYEEKLQFVERNRHQLELEYQTALGNFEHLRNELESKLQISLQAEELLKQRCEASLSEIARARDEYRLKITDLEKLLHQKDLALSNLDTRSQEASRNYQEQLKLVNEELNRNLQGCQQKISSLNDELLLVKDQLVKKSEELIEARAETSHILAKSEQNEKELTQKHNEDLKRVQFDLNEKALQLQKALSELQLVKIDCHSTNTDLQSKDHKIGELSAEVQQCQGLISKLQEQMNVAQSAHQQGVLEHETVQQQCQGLLDQVAFLQQQVGAGEEIYKNLQFEHQQVQQLMTRLKLTEQQRQQCLLDLQNEVAAGGQKQNCQHAMDVLNQIKIESNTEDTEKLLNLQRDLNVIRNQLAERNQQFDVQKNELLLLQAELLRAQDTSARCTEGQNDQNSVSLNNTQHTQHITQHVSRPSNLVELQVQLSQMKISYGQLSNQFEYLRRENIYLLNRLNNAVNTHNSYAINDAVKKLAQVNNEYNTFKITMQNDNYNLQKMIQDSMLQLQDQDRVLKDQKNQITNLQIIVRNLPMQCKSFATLNNNEIVSPECSNLVVDNKRATDILHVKEVQVQELKKQVSSLFTECSSQQAENKVCIQKPCVCSQTGSRVKQVHVVTPPAPPKIIRIEVPIIKTRVVVKEVAVPQINGLSCPPPRIETIQVPKIIIQKVPIRIPVPSQCILPDLSSLYDCNLSRESIDQLSLPNYSTSQMFKFKQTLLSLITRQRNCMAASSSTSSSSCNLPVLQVPEGCVQPTDFVDSLVLEGINPSLAGPFKMSLLNLLNNVELCSKTNCSTSNQQTVFSQNQTTCATRLPFIELPSECVPPLQYVQNLPIEGFNIADVVSFKQSLFQLINKLQNCQPTNDYFGGKQCPPPRIEKLEVPKIVIKKVPIRVPVPSKCPVTPTCNLPVFAVPQGCVRPSDFIHALDIGGYDAFNANAFKLSLLNLLNNVEQCTGTETVAPQVTYNNNCPYLPLFKQTQDCVSPQEIVETVNLEGYSPSDVMDYKQTLYEVLTHLQGCSSRPSEAGTIATTTCDRLPKLPPVKECIAPPEIINQLNLNTFSQWESDLFRQTLLELLMLQQKCCTSQPARVIVKEVPVVQPPKLLVKQVPVRIPCDHKTNVIVKEKPVFVPSAPKVIVKTVPVRVPVRVKVPVEVPKIVVKEVKVPYNVPVPVRVVQPPKIIIKQVPVPVPQPPRVIIKQIPVIINKTLPKPTIIYKDRAVPVPSPPRIIVKQVPVRINVPVKIPVQIPVKVPIRVPVPYRVEVKIPSECSLPEINIDTCVDISDQIDSMPLINYASDSVTKFKQNLYSMLLHQRECVRCQCRLPTLQVTGCEALQNQIEAIEMTDYNQNDIQVFKQALLGILDQQRACSSVREVKVPVYVPQPSRIIVKQVPVAVPQPPKIIHDQIPVVISKCNQKPRIIVKEKPVPVPGPPIIKEVPVRVPVPIEVPGKCNLPSVYIHGCEELQQQIESIEITDYTSEEVARFKQNLLSMLLEQRNCIPPPNCSSQPIYVKVPVKVEVPKEVIKHVRVPYPVQQPPRIIVKQVSVPVPQPPKVIIKQVPVPMPCDHKPKIIIKEKPVTVQLPPRVITKEVPVRVPVKSDCHLPNLQIKPCENLQNSIAVLAINGFNSEEVSQFKEDLLSLLTDQEKCIQCQLPNINVIGCDQVQGQVESLDIKGYSEWEIQVYKQKLLTMLLDQRNCVPEKQCLTQVPKEVVKIATKEVRIPVRHVVEVPKIMIKEVPKYQRIVVKVPVPVRQVVHVPKEVIKEVRVPVKVEVPKEVIKVVVREVKVPVQIPVPQPPKVLIKQVPVKIPQRPMVIVKQVPVLTKCDHKPKIIIKEKPIPVQVPPRTIVKEVPVRVNVPVRVPVPIKTECHLPQLNVNSCENVEEDISSLILSDYSPSEATLFKQKLFSILQQQRNCIQCELPQIPVSGCDEIQNQIASLNIPNYSPWNVQKFKENLLTMLLDQRNCVKQSETPPKIVQVPVNKVIYQRIPVKIEVPKIIVKEVKVPVIQQVPISNECHLPQLSVYDCESLQNDVSSLPLSDYNKNEATAFKQNLLDILLQQRSCIECKLPEIRVSGCVALQNQIASLSIPNYSPSESENFKQNLFSLLMEQRDCCESQNTQQRVKIVRVPVYQRIPVRVPVPVPVPKEVIKEVKVPVQVPVPQPPKILIKEVPVPVSQPPRIIVKQVPVMVKCDHKPKIIVKEKPIPVQSPPRTIVKEVPVRVNVPIRVPVPVKSECHLPQLNVNGCEEIQNYISSLVLSDYSPTEAADFKEKLLSILLQQRNCINCRLPEIQVSGCQLEYQIASLNLPNYSPWDVQHFKENLLTMLLDQRNCCEKVDKEVPKPIIKVVIKRVPVPVKQIVEVPKEIVREVKVPIPVPQPPKILIKQITVPIPQPPRVIIKQIPVMAKCDHKPKIIIKEKPVPVQMPPRTIVKEVPVKVMVPVPVKTECRLPIVNINSCENIQNQIASLVLSDYNSAEVEHFKQNLLSILVRQRDCVECHLPEINVRGCENLQDQVDSLVVSNYNGWEVEKFKESLLSLVSDQRNCVEKESCPRQVVKVPIPVPPKVIVKEIPVPVPQPPKVVIKQVPVIISKCNQKPRIIIKEKPVPVPMQLPPRTIIKEVPVRIPVPVRVPVSFKREFHLPEIRIGNCESIQADIDALAFPGFHSFEVSQFKKDLFALVSRQRDCQESYIHSDTITPPPKVECPIPDIQVHGCIELAGQVEDIIIPNVNSEDLQRFKQNLLSILLEQRNCASPAPSQVKVIEKPVYIRVPVKVPVPVRVPSPPKVLVKQVPVPVPQPPKIIVKQVPVPMKCDHKQNIIIRERPVPVPSPPRTIVKEVPVKIMVPVNVPVPVPQPPKIVVKQVPVQLPPRIIKVPFKVTVPVKTECHLPQIKIGGCDVQGDIEGLDFSGFYPEEVSQFKQDFLSMLLEQRNCVTSHTKVVKVPDIKQSEVCSSEVVVKQVPVPVPQPPKIIIKQIPIPIKCDHKPHVIIREKPVPVSSPPRTIIKEVPVPLPPKVIIKKVPVHLPPRVVTKEIPVKVFVKVPVQNECHLPEINIGSCESVQADIGALAFTDFGALEVLKFKQDLLSLISRQRDCQGSCVHSETIGPPPKGECGIPNIEVHGCVELQGQIDNIFVPNTNLQDVQLFKQNLLAMLLEQRNCVTCPTKIIKVPVEKPVYVKVPVKVPVPVRVPLPPKVILKQVPVPVPQPPRVIVKQVPVPMPCDHKQNIIIKEKPVPVPSPPRTIVKEVPVKVMVPVKVPVQVRVPVPIPQPPKVIIKKVPVQLPPQVITKTVPVKVPVPVRVPVEKPVYVRVPVKIPVPVRVPLPPKVILKQVPVPVPQPPRVIVKQIPVPMPCDHKQNIIIKEKPVPVPSPPRTIVREVPVKVMVPVRVPVQVRVPVPIPQPPKVIIKKVPVQLPPQVITKEIPVLQSPKVIVPIKTECHLPEIRIGNCESVEADIGDLGFTDFDAWEVSKFKQDLMALVLRQRNCQGSCAHSEIIAPPPKVECQIPDIQVHGCVELQEQVKDIIIPNVNVEDLERFKQNLLSMLLEQRNCVNPPPGQVKVVEKPVYIRVPVKVPVPVRVPSPPKVLVKQVPVPVPQPPKIIVKQVPVPMKCDHKQNIIIRERPVPVPSPPRTIVKEVPVKVTVPVKVPVEVRVPVTLPPKIIVKEVVKEVPRIVTKEVVVKVPVPIRVPVPVKTECHLPEIEMGNCESVQADIGALAFTDFSVPEVSKFKQDLLSLVLRQRDCQGSCVHSETVAPPPRGEFRLPNIQVHGCVELEGQVEDIIIPDVNSEDLRQFKQNLLSMLFEQRNCVSPAPCQVKVVEKPVYIRVPIKVPVPVGVPSSPKVLVKQVPVPVPQPPKVIVKQIPVPVKCDHKPKIIIREKPVPVPSPPRTIVKEVPVKVPVSIKVPVEVRVPVTLPPKIIVKEVVKEVPRTIIKQVVVKVPVPIRVRIPVEKPVYVKVPVKVPVPVRVPLPAKVILKQVPVPVPQPPRIIVKQIPVPMPCDHKQNIIIKEKPVPVPSSPRTIVKEIPVKVMVPVRVPVQVKVPVPIPQPPKVIIKKVFVQLPPQVITKEGPIPQPPKVIVKQVRVEVPPRIITKEVKVPVPVKIPVPIKTECHLPEVECQIPDIQVHGCVELQEQVKDIIIPNVNIEDLERFKQNLLSMLFEQRNCVRPAPGQVKVVEKPVYIRIPVKVPVTVRVPTPPKVLLKQVPVPVPQPPKIIVKQVPVPMKCDHKQNIIIRERPVPVPSPPRTIVKEVPVKVTVPVKVPVQVKVPVILPPKIIVKEVVKEVPRIVTKQVLVKVPVRIPVQVKTECHLPQIEIGNCESVQADIDALVFTDFSTSEVSKFKQDLFSLVSRLRNCVAECRLPNIQVHGCTDLSTEIENVFLPNINSNDAQLFKQNLLSMLLEQRNCVTCSTKIVKVPVEKPVYIRVPVKVPVPVRVPLPPKVILKQVPVPVPQPPRVIVKQVPIPMPSDHKQNIIIKEKPVPVPSPPRTIVKEVPVKVMVPVKVPVQVKVPVPIPQPPKVIIKKVFVQSPPQVITKEVSVKVPVRVPVEKPVYVRVPVKIPVPVRVPLPPKVILKQVPVSVPQPPRVIVKQIPVPMPCDHKQNIIIKEKPVPVPSPPRTIVKEVPVKVMVPVRVPVQVRVPVPIPQPPKVIIKEVFVQSPPQVITKEVPVPQPPKVIVKQVRVEVPPRIITKEVKVTVPVRIPVPIKSECHLPEIRIGNCESVEADIGDLGFSEFDAWEVSKFKQDLMALVLRQRNCQGSCLHSETIGPPPKVECQIPNIQVHGCVELQEQVKDIIIPSVNIEDLERFKQNLLSMLFEQRNCVSPPPGQVKVVEKPVYIRVPVKVPVPVRVPSPSKVLVKQVPVPVPQPPKIIVKQIPVPMKCDHKQNIIIRERPVAVPSPPRTIVKEVPVKVTVPVKVPVEVRVPITLPPKIIVKEVVKEVPRIVTKEVVVKVPVPIRVPVPVKTECHLPEIEMGNCESVQADIGALAFTDFSVPEVSKFKQDLLSLVLRQRDCQGSCVHSEAVPPPPKVEYRVPNIQVHGCVELEEQVEDIIIPDINSEDLQQFKQNLLAMLIEQRNCVSPAPSQVKVIEKPVYIRVPVKVPVPVGVPSSPKVLVKQVPVPVPQPPKVIVKQIPVPVKCDHKPKIIIREKPVPVPSPPRTIVKEVPVKVPVSIKVPVEVRVPVTLPPKIIVKEVVREVPRTIIKQVVVKVPVPIRVRIPVEKPVYVKVPVKVPVPVRVPLPAKVILKQVPVPVPQPPRVIVKQIPVPMPCDHKQNIIIKEKPVPVPSPPRTIVKEVPVKVMVPVRVPVQVRVPVPIPQPPKVITKEIPLSQPPKVIVKQVRVEVPPRIITKEVKVPVPVRIPVPIKTECHLPEIRIGNCESVEADIGDLGFTDFDAWEVSKFKQDLMALVLRQRNCQESCAHSEIIAQPPKVECQIPDIQVHGCVELQEQVKDIIIPNVNVQDLERFKQNLLSMLFEQRNCVSPPPGQVKVVEKPVYIRVPVKIPVPVRVPSPPKVLVKQVPVPVPQPPKIIVKQIPVPMKCDHKQNIIIRERPVPVPSPPRTIVKEVPVKVTVPVKVPVEVRVPVTLPPKIIVKEVVKEVPRIVTKEVVVKVPVPIRVPVPVKTECHLPEIEMGNCESVQADIGALAFTDFSVPEVSKFKQDLLSLVLRQRECQGSCAHSESVVPPPRGEYRIPNIQVHGCVQLEGQVEDIMIPGVNSEDLQQFKQNLLSMLFEQRNCVSPAPCQVKVVEKPVYIRVPVKVPVPVGVPSSPKVLVKQVPVPVPQPPQVIVKQIPVPMKCDHKPKIIIREKPVPVPSPPRTIVKEVPVRVPVPIKVPVEVRVPVTLPPKIIVKEVVKEVPRTIIKQVVVKVPVPIRVPVPVRIPVEKPVYVKVPVKVPVPVRVPLPPKVILKQVPVPVPQPPRVIVKQVPVPMPCDHKPNIIIKERPVPVPSPPKTIVKEIPVKVMVPVRVPVQVRVPVPIPQPPKVIIKKVPVQLPPQVITKETPIKTECHLPEIKLGNCESIEADIGALAFTDFNVLEVSKFKQDLFLLVSGQRNCVPPSAIAKAECRLSDIQIQGCIDIPEQIENLILPNINSEDVQRFKQNLLSIISQQRNCVNCPGPIRVTVPPKVLVKEVPVPVPQPPKVIIKQIPVPMKCDHKVKVVIREKPVPVPSPPRTIVKEVPVQLPPRLIIKEVKVKVPVPGNLECRLPEVTIGTCESLYTDIDNLAFSGFQPSEVFKFKQEMLSLLSKQRECVAPLEAPNVSPSVVHAECRLPIIQVYGCTELPSQIENIALPNNKPEYVEQFKRNLLSMLLEQRNCARHVTVEKPIYVKVPVKVPILLPPKVLVKQVPIRIPQPPKIIVKQVPVPVKCDHKPKIIIKDRPVPIPSPPRTIVKEVPVRVPVPVKVPVEVRVPVSVKTECHLPEIHVSSCVEIENQIQEMAISGYDINEVTNFKQNLLTVFAQLRNCISQPSEQCQCHLPEINVAGCEYLQPQIQGLQISNYDQAEINYFKQNLFSLLVQQRQCAEKIVPKRIIQQVPVPQAPKIIEKRIPVPIYLPPRIIVKEVKVPVIHGKSCPPPVVERVIVPQPPKIIEKPVLVQVKVPPKVLERKIFVPCVLPRLPVTQTCNSPENYLNQVQLNDYSADDIGLFKNALLQLLKQQLLCHPECVPTITTGRFVPARPQVVVPGPSRPSYCQNVQKKMLQRVRHYMAQLCAYRKLIRGLKLKVQQLVMPHSNSLHPQIQRPAVPIPIMHAMKQVHPSLPISPFQYAPSSVGVSSATFVADLHKAYKDTQEALTHCMDAILAQQLTQSQIKTKCNNCYQLIQDRELAENQIKFLNSIIVDIQKKNEEQRARIEILEAGCSPAMADELKLIGNATRQVPPRVYCDICEEFDLHETEDCPQQNTDVAPFNGRGQKQVQERPYCEICEAFGHATEDCQEDQTF